ncbi:hypothetical protein BDW67DRAFT_157064 [Aspergillus spinulosporus]
MSRIATTTPSGTSALKYDGYASFAATLQDNLHSGHEVLDFSGVSAEDFNFLASDSHRPLKSAKFTYNFLTGLLTIRMSRFAHDTITGLFRAMVDKQLFTMGIYDEVLPLASPLTVLDNWAKEPDACWAPESTGNLTVVLEVGASESAPRLAIDAKAWLETPGTTVKACIIIDISQANSLIIEVWQLGRRAYTVSSRNLPSPAMRVQHVEIFDGEVEPQIHGWKTDQDSGVAFTDEIRLEFAILAGRPPATNLEQDVVMDRSILIAFAKRFWCH